MYRVSPPALPPCPSSPPKPVLKKDDCNVSPQYANKKDCGDSYFKGICRWGKKDLMGEAHCWPHYETIAEKGMKTAKAMTAKSPKK